MAPRSRTIILCFMLLFSLPLALLVTSAQWAILLPLAIEAGRDDTYLNVRVFATFIRTISAKAQYLQLLSCADIS